MNTEHKNAPRPSDGGLEERSAIESIQFPVRYDSINREVVEADGFPVVNGDNSHLATPLVTARGEFVAAAINAYRPGSAGGDVVERVQQYFRDYGTPCHNPTEWMTLMYEMMKGFAQAETAQLRAEVERLREKNEGARRQMESVTYIGFGFGRLYAYLEPDGWMLRKGGETEEFASVLAAELSMTELITRAESWLAANPVKEEKDG